MVTGAVSSIGSAFPASFGQEELWEAYFRRAVGDDRRARMAWLRAGVERRAGVVRPDREDVSAWPTSRRMERFVTEAVPLGRRAAEQALAGAGMRADEVDRLVVATCTGYATPGVDVLLARELEMRPTLDRVHIGHMGCHAALPALATAADAAGARSLTSLVLCLELPSLHLQPDPGAPDQVVPHALFGDAAAAAVVAPNGPGLEVVDVASRTDLDEADRMRWDVTDQGFRMRLSPAVPRILARHLGELVGSLLDRHGLGPGEVAGWAVHPGGPRILDVVETELGLEEKSLHASRRVLAEHGNCSSASVLLALDRLHPGNGEHVVAIAFGPGLTLSAALLRQRD